MGSCKKELQAAIRAKDLALEKMARKDFPGARKLAAKAQKLNPDLEDIVQIILVCDVHGSDSDKKIALDEEDERDWYKILDIDPTADEASVKKQYNKMALILHPDKNRFPGAADAFQLICRAKAVLTNNEKRRSYDSRRRNSNNKNFVGFSGFQNNNLGFARFQDPGFARFRHGPPPSHVFEKVKLSENNKSFNNLAAQEVDVDMHGKERNKFGSSNPKENVKRVKGQNRKKKTVKESEKNGTQVDTRGSCVEKLQFPGNYSASLLDLKNLEYSDSELNDFEKGRAKKCFGPGQIWAVYDTLDAMPRFYALINNVITSDDFKVHITWLEPCPDNEIMDKKWLYNGLPASCGKFRLGESENIEDHAIFSHLVNWKKDINLGNIYQIYPRNGETWAVFKNWKMDWCLDPEKHNKGYEFDFVEILSDYNCDRGVVVAFLGKIKGFSTLFSRMDGEEVIPVKDKFRFSHRVSSFRMTSNEGPNGNLRFFELDPASLPGNFNSLAFAFSEISTISGIFN